MVARPSRKSKSPPENAFRCPWAKGDFYVAYHDREWGVPVHHDRLLFEYLVLGGAQAGLSWATILKKRDNYRQAFDAFDPVAVARYGKKQWNRLLRDEGIVRNRLKILSATVNAKAFLRVQEECGSFDKFIWGFVEGRTLHNTWRTLQELPPRTAVSDAMSRELKRRGFQFVGSTICYAFMQATGMVNDHLVDCFRHAELKAKRRK